MRDRTYISLFHTDFDTKETREIKLSFDKVDKVSINVALQVCTSDTVRGKNKTDHAYRKQNVISISGTFSERTLETIETFSKNNSKFFNYGANKIKNVQELFLAFLNDSRLFFIYTRVKSYKNYVLKSCSFSHSSSVSSIDVNLSFVEVMLRNNEEVYLNSSNYVSPKITLPHYPPLSDYVVEEEIVEEEIVEEVTTSQVVTEEEEIVVLEETNGDVVLVENYNEIVEKVYDSGFRKDLIRLEVQ